jgi:hypothetical protein
MVVGGKIGLMEKDYGYIDGNPGFIEGAREIIEGWGGLTYEGHRG